MVTITKIKIQEEARKLQSDKVSYTQALEIVAKKYGFKSYAALKAVVLDKTNINPFNIEIDYNWFEFLVQKGIMDKRKKNDITSLCISEIRPLYEYEVKKDHLLKGHYNWFIMNPKSYYEKVMNSMLIFYANMTAPFENNLREKVNSDLNLFYDDEIQDFIDEYKNQERVRFRIINNDIPFVEFNFKKKETTLYIKSLMGESVSFYKNLFSKKKIDLIFKFYHIKAFPFYNISKIVLIPYMFADEGIEITKKGSKNVSFKEGYFNMWYIKIVYSFTNYRLL